MKWQKVIGIVVVVVLLYSGVSIASYIHLYSPMFKADIKDIVKIASFVHNSKITVKDIIATKAPAPVSAQMEQAARMQASLARSV